MLYVIEAAYMGQLIEVAEFPSLLLAIREVEEYWMDGDGHQYFRIRRRSDNKVMTEFARPEGAPVEYGLKRFPCGGVTQEFCVR